MIVLAAFKNLDESHGSAHVAMPAPIRAPAQRSTKVIDDQVSTHWQLALRQSAQRNLYSDERAVCKGELEIDTRRPYTG